MPPSVIRRMVDIFDCDLYNGFGAGTEAGGQTMFRPADHRRALAGEEHLLGSIGKPIYGCDIKLLRRRRASRSRSGEVGEIYCRSESMMSGYLGQPELIGRDRSATAGSTPATWPGGTRTATSSWPAAPTT